VRCDRGITSTAPRSTLTRFNSRTSRGHNATCLLCLSATPPAVQSRRRSAGAIRREARSRAPLNTGERALCDAAEGPHAVACEENGRDRADSHDSGRRNLDQAG